MVNKASTEKRILDAAKEVFITRGFDGARMQEIADIADINKALLHYYFRSKDK
jgi:AcrR family transcriptional regulator